MSNEALRPYATEREASYLDAIAAAGGIRPAARQLGVRASTIDDAMARLRNRAARQGYAPGHFEHGVAPGFQMGKVTIQRSADGQVERTWERQSPSDEDRAIAMAAALEAVREEVRRAAPIAAPPCSASPLCNLFTITDAHVGALAWWREGGEDWDLSIAEDTLGRAFDHLISSAPRARIAIVNQLGDFFHQDSNKAVTPTHGHLLDADSRFRKIVKVGVRLLRRIVDAALATHDEVHVIMGEGNHDEVSSIWLQTIFAALYENEPRLTVNDSALPYYVFQHGRTMLGFHHGHLKRNEGLPLHFAASYPEIWGSTAKRYIHVGHRHHVEEKEHSGVKVVQHSTLAARDAHAARGGWHSERQAIAITYHADHGEVARSTVTPEMLEAA